jgi:phage protein
MQGGESVSNSILPFSEPIAIETKEVKEAKEWAWDFKKNEFLLKNGKMYLVYRDEAIKIWLWKLLKTEKYEEIIYSWNYGTELMDLIGQGYSYGYIKAEVERYIKEAIELNLSDYIKEVKDIDIDFKHTKLMVQFNINTIYNKGVNFEYGIHI